jgi:RNA polymerase sigma-70 factor (ECF subfamily)
MDPISQAWVDCLGASGQPHDECLGALHTLLLRVARHEALRRAGVLDVRGPELEDIAQQAADDALMAIKAKVAGFRGESRFTTWAYRFVVLEVSTKIGRHFWRHRPMAMDEDGWERLPDPLPILPEQRVEHGELLAELRRAIDEDLTPHQRRVFVAVALNEVPMDAFAREIGSNRNAVYKTLFDARRKLRTSLATAGHGRPGAAAEAP